MLILLCPQPIFSSFFALTHNTYGICIFLNYLILALFRESFVCDAQKITKIRVLHFCPFPFFLSISFSFSFSFLFSFSLSCAFGTMELNIYDTRETNQPHMVPTIFQALETGTRELPGVISHSRVSTNWAHL